MRRFDNPRRPDESVGDYIVRTSHDLADYADEKNFGFQNDRGEVDTVVLGKGVPVLILDPNELMELLTDYTIGLTGRTKAENNAYALKEDEEKSNG